jgi:hypothetical protein
MKVLLVTGNGNSLHQQVFDRLMEAGCAAAQPAQSSGHSPQAMQEEILRSLQFDLSHRTTLAQLQPGQAWKEPAADLLLANAHRPVWGWVADTTAVLMDFWQSRESQVRFLLVYSSPVDHLAQQFGREFSSASAMDVEASLREWHIWTDALLRYHLRHADRTLLIDGRAALAAPDELVELLRTNWDIASLGRFPASDEASSINLTIALAAQRVVDMSPDVGALQQQLDDCAQLRPKPQARRMDSAREVWAEACELVNQLRLADEQTRSADALKNENAALSARLSTVLLESGRNESAATELAELKTAHELTCLQLEQVQEELAYYFQKFSESQRTQVARAGAFAAEFWRIHQPDVVALDLRRSIVGDQWYDAEPDGRWTGPGPTSTLELPSLVPGPYRLELEIVDAMAPDILSEAQVEVQGRTYPLDGDFDFPATLGANVMVDGALAQQKLQVSLRVSRTASPADNGSDDRRQLGLRVQHVRLIRAAAHDNVYQSEIE